MEGIGVAYQSGSPFWWNEQVQDLSIEEERELVPLDDLGSRQYRSLPKTCPSDKAVDSVGVVDLIEANLGMGRELGTQVHELFEKIQWWDREETIDEWFAKNSPKSSAKAREVFCRAMSNPEIKDLFISPLNNSEVWTEYSFVLEQEGEMIQGTFDRVVLHFLENGELERADIIDFKTDRLSVGGNEDELVKRHRGQLESYRRALHCLTGLPIAKIKMTLLFTAIPKFFNWN